MTRRSGLLVAAAIALYTLSLPPFGYDLLAFLVGVPIGLLVLDSRRPLARREAWIAGLVLGEVTTVAVGGHWLYLAAHDFFGKPAAVSAVFTAVTTFTHAGVFIGAAVAVSARFARLRSPALRVLALAATWVAFELLRARILYGCPWDFLGHALARRPGLAQFAALGGAYALSWACIVCGASLAAAVSAETRRARVVAIMAAALVPAAMIAFGSTRLLADHPMEMRSERTLRVGLVQANVGRHALWDPARRSDHLDRLIELSRRFEIESVDLVVWAENAVPFLLDADVDARARIQALADDLDAYVLTGAPRSESSGDGSARFFNSAYLFAPGRESRAETYDKSKLLPYVEATPAWASGWLPRVNGIEYAAGKGLRLFQVRGWNVAPLICFESTYPNITRDLAAGGADVFVNISNDSWFDRGAAPAQHFGMTVLRTTETGIPLVRVANTGVSAVVEAMGEIALELPPKSPAVGRYELRRGAPAETLYTAVGDLFAWLCAAFAAVMLWITPAGRPPSRDDESRP